MLIYTSSVLAVTVHLTYSCINLFLFPVSSKPDMSFTLCLRFKIETAALSLPCSITRFQLFPVLFLSEHLINLNEGSNQIWGFGYGLDLISVTEIKYYEMQNVI